MSLLTRDAQAAGESLVREHLATYLKNNGADASFEGWIAHLHPENVTLAGRLRLEGSAHAALW